ncbi:nucleolar protein dao-5-like [Manduca sexta]|uniref:nucleolar protein dao-5-like n=1 Tax=Manduca sexta TaxID=7130 RepID=UPI00188DF3F3|nr:nucleolar protein dao-5-like [Manduca sexta]
MRSQASKPVPKKGDLKTTLKASTSKQNKKKIATSKKVKKLVGKSLAKGQKKNSKDDVATKNDEESTVNKNETTPDTAKVGTSRTRSDSPAKKAKKDPKEKKDTVKTTAETNVKKTAVKKPVKSENKGKTTNARASKVGKNNDPKYKAKTEAAKKTPTKFSKVKTVIKKGTTGNQKKKNPSARQEPQKEHSEIENKDNKNSCDKNKSNQEKKQEIEQIKKDDMIKEPKETIRDDSCVDGGRKTEIKIITENSPDNNSSKASPPTPTDTPKTETERPPKFFTSSRSPRTVDIDVKCLKNSKGNLSVSERFLSMKFETKTDDNCKDKNASNTLVSQGPDIDVYTFTEKVDSPKSILSDFRSPINKNVGRVRPIARVKGTVIDKKTESEKKKYSPHRPIEEVVKQLKANKRSEEITTLENENTDVATSSVEATIIASETEHDDKPKPIVSKSYKMVARKSSVTGKPFSPIKFLDTEPTPNKNEKSFKSNQPVKKSPVKSKKPIKKSSSSDDELDTSKFSLNTKTFNYSSSEESVNESNDDNETKESSGSDTSRNKKQRNKKYKRITDSVKKTTSKELKELSKDSLIDLKDDCALLGGEKTQ